MRALAVALQSQSLFSCVWLFHWCCVQVWALWARPLSQNKPILAACQCHMALAACNFPLCEYFVKVGLASQGLL